MLLIDPSLSWPPLDPDRMLRSSNRPPFERPFLYDEDLPTAQNDVDAFRRRQQEDLKRYDQRATTPSQRRPLREQHKNVGNREDFVHSQSIKPNDPRRDREGWRDSEGDRCKQFFDLNLHFSIYFLTVKTCFPFCQLCSSSILSANKNANFNIC